VAGEQTGSLEAGADALGRAAWEEARENFTAALGEAETPEALLGLGQAARAQLDGPAALEAHERGYRLARVRREDGLAARLALELVIDAANFRGPAEAGGWLERAGRLLQDVPPGPEHGMYTYLRGRLALSLGHDPAAAREWAGRGIAMARAGGSVDGEMACVALEGLALVADGRVEEGMRRLDEATTAAVAGEIADRQIVEVVCCHLIDACQRVRDFDRAGEWCRRVEAIAARQGGAEMFATCRTIYGELLVWRGAWGDAEETLAAVCRDLAAAPGRVGDGLVRLAELRRRQGRLDEATALLTESGEHRLAPVVAAAVAIDRGDPARGAEEAERHLRRVGPDDRFERVGALEILVRAGVAMGAQEPAARAAAELEAIAESVPTTPLRAAALLARGRVAASAAPEAARAGLEDAADLFAEAGLRYEAARARAELARVLRALGRHGAADEAEARARAELSALGVPVPGPSPRPRDRDGLTPREREVLRLLAGGRSNEAIAAELVLSVRTVESHVASVYGKIGVAGRTARAAATAYALSHGLA
jgi:DNA-binding NarL/FixJ family response regulator